MDDILSYLDSIQIDVVKRKYYNANKVNAVFEEIRSLAEKEPCVLVGRCADYILKDRNDVLRVFIHAPMEFRLKRASSVHVMPEAELNAYIIKKDEKKAAYYHEYTGGNWDSAENYDLSLNTAELGIHGCVDRIMAYLQILKNE